MKIAIVSSMFNEKISNSLISGAIECYKDVTNQDFNQAHIYKVPGAFEIPFLIKRLLTNQSNDFDAVVTLGCIIKGETAHFEYISSSVTDSLSKLSISEECHIPIIYGILTTYDYQQALERSDPNKKNKGGEVMSSAIDAIDTYQKINQK